ncbi:SusC/RagA family TonB-linked outer membrane protein [Spirosoma taeanense]|uniref:SusC/RagA family TonB-linked outer membrane protein n=2 Tax=Spirosoma taeanense TaxID=2735870 RepID=A0A6M5YEA4_9BACT|nr:SusC/RagA family TonB-linked outer membrane protein [Spirosoma taeanense]
MRCSLAHTLLAVLFTSVALAFDLSAQELLNRRVSFRLENQSLRQILKEIESQADVRFAFRPREIPFDQKLTLIASNESLGDVLNKMVRPLRLRYEVVGRQIVLSSVAPTEKAAAAPSGKAASQLAEQIVTGTVVDDAGQSLPGVNVVVKGTSRGTSTDVDGKFRLAVPDPKSVLVFSFLGYEPQEIAVENRTDFRVTLKTDSKTLNEVVVVGYGTQKKADLTGAVATVSAEKLKNKAAVSYGEALVGQLAGVQVQQIDGAPGGEGLSIRVRGTGSITAGSSPLYVIDGYPMEGSAFSLVNPSDIESIQVLKDASSTAIYGSRGANGVVIVTTKKGKVGPPTIAYNAFYGFQQVARKMDMMNSQEYLEFFKDGHNQAWLDRTPMPGDPPHSITDGNAIRQKYTNSNFYIIPESFNDPKNFGEINWQDEIFRVAPTQRHELSLTGGVEKARYAISGSYTDQQGIQINSDYKRYNLRTNITSNISKKVEMGISVSGYFSENNSVDNGKDSPLAYAVYLPPIYPLRNPDGTYGSQVRNPEIWAGDVANPVGIAENITNFTNRNGLIASSYLQYEIIPGLRYKLSLNGTLGNRRLKYYRPSFVDTDGSRAPKTADARNETWMDKDWLIEHTLNYSKTLFTKHSINLLAGYTAQKSSGEYARVNAQNFPNDVVRTLSAGQIVSGTNTEYENSLISYLSRVNYSYEDKYLLTASIRADGSSRFGANNKWGTFPSVSVGWRVNSESFMSDVRSVSDLKLRASWGLVGNNRIGNYDAIARTGTSYYVLNGNLVNSVDPINYPNPDLGWEKTRQWNLGFDLGLLNERIRLEADFYNSRSVDLLLNVPVPTLTGYASQLQNIGQVENKGMEYLLRTRNLTGKLKWSTDFNMSFNRNKVLALGPDQRPIYAGAPNANNTFVTTIGLPVATFYGYLYDGVFKNQAELDAAPHLANDRPGDPRYIDVNKDGVINASDKTYLGNNQPRFIFGFSNDFAYKGFDLNVQLTGSQGAKLFSFFNRMVGIYHGDRNGLTKLNDRWRSEENPGSGMILRANRDPKGLQKEPSSYWVEDGSFVRIRNLSLGYTFNSALIQKIHVKGLRAYLTGQNLYTFTKYPGFDPETSSQGDGLSRGGDYLGYPSARTIILGLNVSF